MYNVAVNKAILKGKSFTSYKSFRSYINNARPYTTEVSSPLNGSDQGLKVSQMMMDWNKISTKDFQEKVERQTFHDLSLPWKFDYIPRGFWDDIENQKKFIYWTSNQLKINDMSDWYHVSKQALTDLGGTSLLTSTSLYKLLSTIYPSYDWLPWKFDTCPHRYFDDLDNQRKFLEWAKNELKINEMKDWYNVSNKDFLKIGGNAILSQYNNSVSKMLSTLFPQYEWLPWRFSNCPRHFWSDVKNQRKFMEWAGKELKSDWYNVSQQEFFDLGGHTLFRMYSSSFPKLLSAIFPEYEWLPWKFNRIKGIDNTTKKFMEVVEKEYQIKDMKDWYNVSKDHILRLEGGNRILKAHNGSVFTLLKSVFPEYGWLPWKFPRPEYVWSIDLKNFVNWMGKELNVKEINDWVKINEKQVIDLGGGSLLVKYHTLAQLLSRVFSDLKWENNKSIWKDESLASYYVSRLSDSEADFLYHTIKKMGIKGNFPLTQELKIAFPKYNWAVSKIGKKTQYMLKECLGNILKGEQLEEYKHPEIINLELDYFYPQYKLAIEYQGIQHYEPVDAFHRNQSVEEHRMRDKTKGEMCKEMGITLVEIPYWWDLKSSSLAVTIYNARPDLFSEKPQGKAISLVPPPLRERKRNHVVMTATEWETEKMDPKGWYMTEKYDGMRLYWNGTQFYSRQGEKINAPESITKQLPSVPLDGELWTQYGLYQDAVSISRTMNEKKWKTATFWIFDSPQFKPLEERIEFLQQLKLPSFARVVEFVKCEGKEHLNKFIMKIIAKGGEGVVLREPQSVYKAGRSTSLRKYKLYFDSEVQVVKNEYPHGFSCLQTNGKTLFVNITEENLELAKKVKPGAVITVKHSGTNIHGTLLFPQFFRERLDVNWNDLNKV